MKIGSHVAVIAGMAVTATLGSPNLGASTGMQPVDGRMPGQPATSSGQPGARAQPPTTPSGDQSAHPSKVFHAHASL